MPADFPEQNSSFNNHLGYQLRRVSSLAMTELAEALTPLALRITDVAVLFQIAENPATIASDIGRALGIKRANMTPLIAGLVSKGYVNAKAKDGRSQTLSLTRSGRTIYQRSRRIVEQHEQQFFTMLSQNEKHQLSRLLMQVWQHHSRQ